MCQRHAKEFYLFHPSFERRQDVFYRFVLPGKFSSFLLVRRIGERTRTSLARDVPQGIAVVSRRTRRLVPVTLAEPWPIFAPQVSRCAVLARQTGVALKKIAGQVTREKKRERETYDVHTTVNQRTRRGDSWLKG